jgi:subtilisin family serine protease
MCLAFNHGRIFLFMRGVFLSILIFLPVAQAAAQRQPAGAGALARRLDAAFRRDAQKTLSFPFRAKTNAPEPSVSIIWENNFPWMREQSDANANTTINAHKAHPGGFFLMNVDGATDTVAIWDAGKPRLTHQEFGGRVTKADTASVLDNSHATSVAGVAGAAGFSSAAKGAAPAVKIRAYDWHNDASEMAHAASNGLSVSMHPYAETAGWVYNLFADGKWVWYADTTYNSTTNWAFGFYGKQASTWDSIAHASPDYLIVKAAGNLRGRGPVTQPVQHWIPYLSGGSWYWKQTAVSRDINGGNDGYETLSHASVSKNVLTVASVQTIPSGYTQASGVVLASDSGFGPTDDGRIKPDLAVPGVSLTAPISSSDVNYATGSGTSFSAGVAAGAAALVRSRFKTAFGNKPSAAMLRTLLIHTAREAGDHAGPDYKHGWGLLDAGGAVRLISASKNGSRLVQMKDTLLQDGQTLTFTGKTYGLAPLRVTVTWTDPPHAPLADALDPVTAILVNDLDVRVNDGTTHYPWKLNRSAPASAATRSGDNAIDNVEQVLVDAPGTDFTVTISHKGSLSGGSQRFSIIITSGEALAEATVSGTAGWRLLSWPAAGTWEAVHAQSPVQGVAGAPGGIAFAANLFNTYDGTSWEKPSALNNSLSAGTGFVQYFFNNTSNGSQPLPVVLSASGAARTSNIDVALHASGDNFNLVGNPFDAAIDFSHISANGSIQADGQIWDAAAGWRLTSEIQDSIGAFQGFFVENNDATTLTIPVAARISGGRLRKAAVKEGLRFRLEHPDLQPNPDNGFSVVFYEDALTGHDRYDSRKIWPMSSRFAALGGIAGMDVYARISLPQTAGTPVDIPLSLLSAGVSGTAYLVVENSDTHPKAGTFLWVDPMTKHADTLRPGFSVSITLGQSKAAENPLSLQKGAVTQAYSAGFIRFIPATPTRLVNPAVPAALTLHSAYPNPFNGTSRVLFTLAYGQTASLVVYDLSGRKIQTLASRFFAAGTHSVSIHSETLGSGVYLLLLYTQNGQAVQKLTVLK